MGPRQPVDRRECPAPTHRVHCNRQAQEQLGELGGLAGGHPLPPLRGEQEVERQQRLGTLYTPALARYPGWDYFGFADSDPEVVELNEQILKRSLFDSTQLKDGDKVEFLYFMGGGNGAY